MKIQFYIRYRTRFGESLLISLNNQEPVPLSYLNEELWETTLTVDAKQSAELHWSYVFSDRNGELKAEWGSDRKLKLSDCDQDYLQIFDTWNPAGAVENVFFTQPFLLDPAVQSVGKQTASKGNVLFRVKAPLLKSHEAVCLLGHGHHLGNWDTGSPITMTRDGNWWAVRVNLADEHFPVSYKYGIWDTRAGRFAGYEDGYNRTLALSPGSGKRISAVTDAGFVRIHATGWRAAGVSIPVFSLRSEKSWGTGEFSDINMLSDWAGAAGMKMIQLLPV
ncbi:MAG: 4-alpha-glucanotransferase, partial [Bacteroidota bacterium]